MEVLLIVVVVVIGGLLNFIIKPKGRFVQNVAVAYIFLAALVSICSWVFYFAGIKNGLVNNVLNFLATWGKYPGRLILGYLTVYIWLALKAKKEFDTYPLKKLIRSTLWAVTIITVSSFWSATVGKLTSFADMVSFFIVSGYAIWFLYFIMIAETLGGLGVLLHFKLKTGPMASAGLQLIMLGAIYTHWHNNDPFSDSAAAISQLITLTLLQLIYYDYKANSTTENIKSPAYSGAPRFTP
jgi:putative oxidoreductase